VKVSDYVAHFLASKNVKHVFTISGSGNVHLLDSIARHPALVYICPHHEQAGIMAANAYGRISSRPGVMLTTSGAGAANAVTGVLGAWADSVPIVVLSGQERTVFARLDNPSRMWGLQGWNVTRAVQGITKYAMTIRDPLSVRFHLEKAFHIAFSGRPGPVWLDFPTDVQAASVQPDQMVGYEPEDAPRPDLTQEVPQVISWLKAAKRPVILLAWDSLGGRG